MTEPNPPSPDIDRLLEHASWVRRLAVRLVGAGAPADDVVQETWLAAMRRPPRHDGNPRAWLGRVVQRTVRRLRRRDQALAPSDEPSFLGGAGDVVERAAMHREMTDLVMALPEPYRSVVLLRFFEDLPPRRIAARLDVPVETVRTRLKRGVAILRDELERRHPGDVRHALALLLPLPVVSVADTVVGAAKTTLGSTVASGGAAGGSLAGVLLMSTGIKVTLLGSVVVLGMLAVWWMNDRDEPERLESVETGKVVENGSRETRRRSTVTETPSLAVTTSEASPAGRQRSIASPLTAIASAAIRGRVVDRDGRPIAEARVVLFSADDVDDYHDVTRRSLLGDDAVRDAIETTTSRGDGTYHFAEAVDGAMTIAAWHHDRGVGLTPRVVAADSPKPRVVDVTIQDGIVIHGRVTTETGEGIPKALIDISAGRGPDRGGVGPSGTSYSGCGGVRTDATGRFRSLRLPFRAFYLGVTASGYFDSDDKRREFEVAEGEWHVEIVLQKAPRYSGRIRYADGTDARLAEHAVASAREAGIDLAANYWFEHPLRLLAAPRAPGERVRPVSVDELERLSPTATSYSVQPRTTDVRYLIVAAGDVVLGAASVSAVTDQADIVVDPSLLPRPSARETLRVTVRDVESGEPISNYVARLRWSGDRVSRRTHSTRRKGDDDGCCMFEDMKSGRLELSVVAPGFEVWWESIELAVGAVREIEVRLTRATAVIRGVVVDDEGRPIVGAAVYSERFRDGRVLRLKGIGTKTDAEGHFELIELAPGDHLVLVEKVGFAPAAKRLTASPAPGRAEIRLEEGVTVTMRFEGASGPFSVLVRDAAELVHLDDETVSRTRYGAEMTLQLLRGVYEVVVDCPGFRRAVVPFTGERGTVVVVEFEPENDD